MRGSYLDGVALQSAVLDVDECAFNFAGNLSEDVGGGPDPDVEEGVLEFVVDVELFELALFFPLILVGEIEEEEGQHNHDCVDDQFGQFWVGGEVPLQWPRPELTM